VKLDKSTLRKEATRYVFMVIGAICYGAGYNLFLVPNAIVTGGVAGLSTIINLLTGLSLGLFNFLFNLPILIAGWKEMGRNFILRCLLTTTVISLFMDLFSIFPAFTNDKLMASIYGGVFLGVGTGFFYRYLVSGGGSELLARLLIRRIPGFSAGSMIMILDGAVVLFGTIVMRDPQNLLYAMILIFIVSKVSDSIISGFNYAKMCFIVTDHLDEMSHALMEHFHRGVTRFSAVGMYSGEQKDVLYIVVKPNELVELKEVILQVDKRAFLTVGQATEALGGNFMGLEEAQKNR
jgi:uncharacterized membrane-anchored protein YitT (DUF2179 family)